MKMFIIHYWERASTYSYQLQQIANVPVLIISFNVDRRPLPLLFLFLFQTGENGASSSDIIPFRESKLTHLLMPLLGRTGLNGVAMVVCVNPQGEDYDETISVLGTYAHTHSDFRQPLIYYTLKIVSESALIVLLNELVCIPCTVMFFNR